MSLIIAQQFMKEMVKNYFGLLNIPVKFLINWNLEVSSILFVYLWFLYYLYYIAA